MAILLYNQNSKAVCHVIMSHKGHNCDKTQLATRIHSLQLEWQVSFIHLSNNKHFMSPQGYASLVTAAEPPYRNTRMPNLTTGNMPHVLSNCAWFLTNFILIIIQVNNNNYRSILSAPERNFLSSDCLSKEDGKCFNKLVLKQSLGKEISFYNILHGPFFLLFFFVSSAAFVAILNTSLTPSLVLAEHSK